MKLKNTLPKEELKEKQADSLHPQAPPAVNTEIPENEIKESEEEPEEIEEQKNSKDKKTKTTNNNNNQKKGKK